MIELIPLDLILPNPWQPRQYLDPTKIQSIADSITAFSSSRAATGGLLQVPAGRLAFETIIDPLWLWQEAPRQINLPSWMRENGIRLELAYGHRRLAAMQLLKRDGMHIDIGLYSDEEMAFMGLSENEDRDDLTPIELANAIQRLVADFGLTQEQVGERLGKSRSAVANTLRLLKLPEAQQKDIQEGSLSERQAMALLPLFDLPQELLDKAEQKTYYQPSKIIEAARKGESSTKIRESIRSMVSSSTMDLDLVAWSIEYRFNVKDVVAPVCTDCDLFIRQGKVGRCSRRACAEIKTEAWQRMRLEEASRVSGIPPLPDGTNWGYFEMFYDKQQFLTGEGGILAARCPNLRLRYDAHATTYKNGVLAILGIEDAMVVCDHGKDARCECLARRQEEHRKTDPQVLKDKQDQREFQEVWDQAGQELAKLIADDDLCAWLMLLRHISSRYTGKGDKLTIEQLKQRIAVEILKSGFYSGTNPEQAKKHIAMKFTSAGLELNAIKKNGTKAGTPS